MRFCESESGIFNQDSFFNESKEFMSNYHEFPDIIGIEHQRPLASKSSSVVEPALVFPRCVFHQLQHVIGTEGKTTFS